MNQSFRLNTRLSFGEEIGNCVSHGLGAGFALIALPITAIYAYQHYPLPAVISMSVFLISLFLMFLASTIYHAMEYGSTHKYILRMVDHSMIYIAIAGSYTPVALALVGGILGWFIMALQWGITLFGIFYKILAKKVNEKFSLILYLVMGWLVVFVIPAIVQKASPMFWLWMLLGGILYSIGAVFYAQKKPYFHMIWHLFIFFASLAHYIGIVFFML